MDKYYLLQLTLKYLVSSICVILFYEVMAILFGFYVAMAILFSN